MESLQEGHLNSPLYQNAFKNIFEIGFDKVCRRHRRVLVSLANSLDMTPERFYQTCCSDLPDLDLWGTIESIFLQHITPHQDLKMDYYLKIIPNIIQLMTHSWFKKGVINKYELEQFLDFNTIRIAPILHQYHQVGLIKQKIRTTTSNFDKVIKLNKFIIYGPSISVIIIGENKYIVESNLILGCLDKLQEECLVKICAIFDDYFEHQTPISRYDDICEIIRELKTLRQRLRNDMCHVLKLFEAIIIGYLVSIDAMYPDNELWNSTMTEINKWWPEFQTSYTFRRLIILTSSPVDILYLLSTTSMSKLFGHPLINTQKGYEKLYDTCTVNKYHTIEPSIKVSSTIKLILTKSHFIKFHEWPFSDRNSHLPYFSKFIKENRWPTLKELKEIPINIWLTYNLRGLYDLNLDIPLHDMISDKAIAPKRSEWHTCFDQCCFVASGLKKPYQNTSKRRVIEEYLSIEDPNYIKTVVEEFDQTGILPQEDLIFVLTPKELEEKEEGRMFCKQTHRVRTIQTVSEKNIKDGILPNMESQTMSLSGLDVDHKLGDIAALYFDSLNLGNDYHIIHFNIDFSKWNTNFVLENTFACFAVFDELFNTTYLFQATHKIFQHSIVICSNPVNTKIKLDENREPHSVNGGYTGHRAGFEGMRQKGWTVITQAAIEYHALQNNYTIFLIGQGDNQVISLRVPGKHANKAYVDKYFKSLIDFFESLGLPVKPDETYASSELFSYGRQHYYRGSEAPSNFKKIRRAFPDGNKSHLSVDGDLCSAMTAIESCARSSHQPFTAMALAVVIHIELYSRFIDFEKVPWEDLFVILLHHHIIGGCSQLSTIGFFIRGHEDLLTTVLNLILHAQTCYFCSFKHLNFAKYLNMRKQHNTDYQVLLESPGSVNIYKQSAPTSWLRELGNLYILENSKNPEINGWLNLSTEEDKLNLINTLVNTIPLYVNFVSEVWRCSIPGIKDSMAAKLTNTRTISQAVKDKNENVVNRILTDHLKDIDNKNHYFKNGALGEIEVTQILSATGCSYQAAQYLREYTWNKPIEGITVPVPNELWIPDDNSPFGDLMRNKYGFINIKYDTNDNNSFKTRGPYKPYYGGTTKEKMSQNASMDLEVKNMTREIRRCISLLTWTHNPNLSEFRELIMKTATQMTELRGGDMETLMKIYRFEGGTLDHRLHSAYYSKTISGNSMLNISSHTSVSTNTLSDLIKSQDWTIVYQSAILWATSLSLILQQTSPQWFRFITIYCEGCLNIIKNNKVTVPILPSQKSVVPKNVMTSSPVRSQKTSKRIFSICIGALLGQAERHHQSEFNVKNSLQYSLSKGTKRVINLNDLRKADLSIMLDSLSIHSSLPFIIDFLNFNESPPSLAIFTVTSEHLISAGLVKQLVKCTGVPMMKHGLSNDINKLSDYLTFVLIKRFHNIKVDYLTNVMTKKMTHKVLERIQSEMPLLPLDIYIKVDKTLNKEFNERDKIIRRNVKNTRIGRPTEEIPRTPVLTITHTIAKKQYITGVGLVVLNLNHKSIERSEIVKYLTNIVQITLGPKLTIPSCITTIDKRAKISVPDNIIHPIEYLRQQPMQACLIPAEIDIIYDVREMIPILRDALLMSASATKYTLAPPWNAKAANMCYTVTIEDLYSEYILREVGVYEKVHHKTRLLIKSTSAASKYFEILNSIPPPSYGCILNLAEGAGSVCSLINHMYPTRGYVFNTLMTEININTQDLMVVHCPESLLIDKCDFKNMSEHIDHKSNGDLTSTEAWNFILSELNDEAIGIITMDAESIYQDNSVDILQYLSEYLMKMNLVAGAILIVKLLLSGISCHLNRVITIPCTEYRVMKPVASNPGNEEFFLVCTLNIGVLEEIRYNHLYDLGKQVIMQSRHYINYETYLKRSLFAQSKFIKEHECFDPLTYILQELKVTSPNITCVCEGVKKSIQHHVALAQNLKLKELLTYDSSLQRCNENFALEIIVSKINDILVIQDLLPKMTSIGVHIIPPSFITSYSIKRKLKQDSLVFEEKMCLQVKLSDEGLKLLWKIIGYKSITCKH